MQHPDPDPTQQSHRHHRECQFSKALKLYWIHFAQNLHKPLDIAQKLVAKNPFCTN